MKQLISLLVLLVAHFSVLAQNDTSAYNLQRNRINQLLKERSARFSQYDNSLGKRTGIFGLKTKRDMQASNDILTQIVLTDNDIFSELKVLLDFKDFEKKEVEHQAATIETRAERFRSTITRLQQQTDKLKAENEKQNSKNERLIIYLALSILAAIGALIYAFRVKKLRNPDIREA